MTDKPRIACFLATSGHSGVDRIARNLLPGFAQAGYPVDLLKIRNHGPVLAQPLPDNLRVVEFQASHVYSALPELMRYLRSHKPAVLMADKDRVNRTALLARQLSARDVRLVLRLGTTVSRNLASRSRFDRFVQRNSMRYLYRYADAVMVPSEGAADDFADYVGFDRSRIAVVPSPIITPRFYELVNQPLEHPWFGPAEPPVILGVGELCRRKDFTTLIRAFALIADRVEHRLVILGEGRARSRLEAEVSRLNLSHRVLLPGFVDNPYPYMKASALFVLSSLWEGLGAVIVEALAAGTPVVATDCPSGPAELLHGLPGEPLAEPGDARGLADAMLRQLENPAPPQLLQDSVARYGLGNSVEHYLAALGVTDGVDA